ncbi:hypothetical protein TRVL_09746 [Trypanosoma vivax]|nr:hypothetical protein TRVL_09746 [Trypanosoma vivax]
MQAQEASTPCSCNALSVGDGPNTGASECAPPFGIIFVIAAFSMQMRRLFGIASAKELSASEATWASPCELKSRARSHAPPATHTSPFSLNTCTPHPHMKASATNVTDVARCLRDAAGPFPSNGLSQRLPCLTACAGRPAPPLS